MENEELSPVAKTATTAVAFVAGVYVGRKIYRKFDRAVYALRNR